MFELDESNINEILKQHKLDYEDYSQILSILGRKPNLLELGIFSAMWSEHCSYKSSKIYLKDLPTKAKWVLQGPGENAGVIDIGKNLDNENLVAVFKIESHNHPSFIEPHAGAATGVGGILRDIFTMGANPIANMNLLCFGDINAKEQHKLHKRLLDGSVGGISSYGNCIGVPTIGHEVNFDACYNGNILVNAFSLGIAIDNEIFYGKASGAGNLLIYVGAKSGKDGLGGAVMSSDSFDESSKKLRPTVQIGDPFKGRLLLESCLEVFKKDLIVGIQDMGAAGLTSSSFEMASRGGNDSQNVGIKLWLDKVPTRQDGMTALDLMLSESQERMLICAKKGKEQEIIDIFNKYELDANVIGEVTNTNKVELFWHDEICASLEVAPIVENAPVLRRAIKKPQYLDNLELDIKNMEELNEWTKNIKCENDSFKSFESKESNCPSHLRALKKVTLQMLKSLDFADKGYIYNQYDSTIKNSTIKTFDFSGASVISLQNYNALGALSMSIKSNSAYCYLDPKIGARILVANAGREVAMTGARALAITNCLNFGSPLSAEVMYQFQQTCEGMKEACLALNTPVISGNVSLYNQTLDVPIYPTPSIVSVGKMENYNLAISSHFVKDNSVIFMIGDEFKKDCFSGSLFQKITNCKLSGKLDDINLDVELRLWDCLEELITNKMLLSARDIQKGGLALAILQSCITGKRGAKIDFSTDLSLFSQSHSVVICELDSKVQSQFEEIVKKYNLKLRKLGMTNECKDDKNIVLGELDFNLDFISQVYYNSFSQTINKQ